MSVLVDKKTKIIIQGFTGKMGSFQMKPLWLFTFGESNSIKDPLDIFAALLAEYKGGSCKLTVTDSNVVDDSSC